MCYAFKSNNLFCIFMTSLLDTLFSFNHFVCTCFFVDIYLQRFVYLETYAYERGLILIGIHFSYNSLVAPNLPRECPSYSYLHLCALMCLLKIFDLMLTM